MNETAEVKQDVSGTAFVVNYSRSKMTDISGDVYSKLWVTPESISLWNELAKCVYPNDDLNVSLRCRFYLERMKKFVNENKNPVIVNIACGFDSYPFLLDKKCRFIEIDLPDIIQLKKEKTAQWMMDGILPEWDIMHVSIDLNDRRQRIEMREILKKAVGGNPSFATMEGITYYLDKKVLNDIFNILGEVQKAGSITAFDYWKPDSMEYPVMVKLKELLVRKFGDTGQPWDFLDHTFIKEIRGYKEIESADIAQLERDYSQSRIFQGRDNKIPVYFSVCKKLPP